MPIIKLSKVGELTPWTRTPNIIIDRLMPKLRDTEFRLLIILIRSTVGWNRGGSPVKLSYRMLEQRTGRSSEAISKALYQLHKLGLIHISGFRRRQNAKKNASQIEEQQ